MDLIYLILHGNRYEQIFHCDAESCTPTNRVDDHSVLFSKMSV